VMKLTRECSLCLWTTGATSLDLSFGRRHRAG